MTWPRSPGELQGQNQSPLSCPWPHSPGCPWDLNETQPVAKDVAHDRDPGSWTSELVIGQNNQASRASIYTYRMERRLRGGACVLLSGTSHNCGQLFPVLMRSLKIDLASTIAIILECANLIALKIHACSHQGNFPKPSYLPTTGWMETRKVTATSQCQPCHNSEFCPHFPLGSQEELARLAEGLQGWRLPIIKPAQGTTVDGKRVVRDNNGCGKGEILLKWFLILLRGTSHPRLKHVKEPETMMCLHQGSKSWRHFCVVSIWNSYL